MGIKVVLIDGYIDDPAALGVPPYISPIARAVAGAAIDAGGDVEYITIDMIRKGLMLRSVSSSLGLRYRGSTYARCLCPSRRSRAFYHPSRDGS